MQLCAQLLIYPVLDNTCSTQSATEFVDVPLWNAISNRRMWAMYLSRYRQGELPPYAAPGLGQLQDLADLGVEPRTQISSSSPGLSTRTLCPAVAASRAKAAGSTRMLGNVL